MTTQQFIADVLPLAIAGSCSPTTVAVGILILSSKNRALAKTAIFVLGNLLVLIGAGLATLFFTNAASSVATTTTSSTPNPVDATLDLFVGIFLIIMTVRHALEPKSPTSDAPPKWLRGLDNLGFMRSFLIGVGIMAINITTLIVYLPAVRYVGKYTSDLPNELALFALVVLIVESWMLAVLTMSAVAPGHSQRILRRLNEWIGKHSRTVCLVLFAGIGVYLLIKGLTELF